MAEQASATAPPPAAEKKAKDGPKDWKRETAETVVFVVVLVLMLKTFVAEAFVIPTGSMAETLYGYQKIVECDQCRYVFPVNCSSEVDPPDVADNPNRVRGDDQQRAVTGCICPNCRRELSWKREDGPSWSTGDRVLVAKFLYDRNHVAKPHRFDVLVFKFPKEPQKQNTAINYIKRCLGLENETIGIWDGDIYVTTDLKFPLDDGKPEDAWELNRTYLNDPAAVERFRQSIERRVKRVSKQGDFEIVRKPTAQQLSMRRIVFDNDFQPADLADKVEFRRWRIDDGSAWSGDKPDMPVKFTHTGKGSSDGEWISYRHILRGEQRHPNPPNPDGFQNDPRRLITNQMGYNTGQGDQNREAYGSNWVPDLMLDCEVDVTSDSGEFILELARGIDRFVARFDVATGKCKLVRRSGRFPKVDSEEVLGEVDTRLKGKGNYHLRFSDFDEQLTVWVDGRLPFGDGVAVPPIKERGPIGENDLNPARVGSASCAVVVSKLQLWRDTYYTVTNPARLNDLQDGTMVFETMYVRPGHYLCLGDNSSASSDSRYWGLVPARLLLGRALVIYYPLSRFGFIQ